MGNLKSNFQKFKCNIHAQIQTINNSKIFAGLMIIILNIASKFVNFRFSKSVERYLKYTFSKQILVFAIAWMGTRDIYVALLVTATFIICFDYICNEDSMFCCLPNSIIEHLKELDDENVVPEEDAKKAQEIVERYENQKRKKEGMEENKLLAF